MLKMKEEELLELNSAENISAELFNALSQIPSSITSPGYLFLVNKKSFFVSFVFCSDLILKYYYYY